MQITAIVSGAQTGADLAALDVALELEIPCGGWVPAGRTNEAGRIPARYHGLKETPSPDVHVRTEWNVRDSDATVIFSHGALRGGSLYTKMMAHEHGKSVLHIDLERMEVAEAVVGLRGWLSERPHVRTLNVAGPRASGDPLIYGKVSAVLRALLRPPSSRAKRGIRGPQTD